MEDRSQQKRRLVYFSIAIILFILIGMSYLIVRVNSTPYLAKKYYEIPLAQIQRPNAPPEDSLFEKGMRAFSEKDWSTAISSFGKIEEGHRFHNRSLYYLAHGYIGGKDYQKALEIFNQPDFSDGQYRQQAEWYKLLMEMKLKNQKEMIIGGLRKIKSDPGHLFRDQAGELLERLE